jgi:3-hydroxy-9,10-secoandrosta-1,3,5(10)-triene-9,17-dione monooxygenase reductase component
MTVEDHVEIDSDLFRQVLGQFPTGVTVIASLVDGDPVGLTIGSFFSISLKPPLVGFCVGVGSTSWPLIERSGGFAISVLADDQADVCRELAARRPEKFAAWAWTSGPIRGAPFLDGALAHIECDLSTSHLAGDHWIIVGLVRHLSLHRNDTGPLSFWRGGFGRHEPLGAAAKQHTS